MIAFLKQSQKLIIPEGFYHYEDLKDILLIEISSLQMILMYDWFFNGSLDCKLLTTFIVYDKLDKHHTLNDGQPVDTSGKFHIPQSYQDGDGITYTLDGPIFIHPM